MKPCSRSIAARVRTLVRRVHLWLGLSVGLLFAVLGLTGSALVFYTAIDAALHSAIGVAPAGAAPGTTSPIWDRALATGRARWADPGGKWTVEVTGAGGAIPARYYPAPQRHGDRMMVWFSADGARIVRAERWGGYLMSWLYRLHMQLLAGEVGTAIVGWSGAAMLVLLGSGIAAWWPRGRWRKALAFKRDAAPIRRLRDLHKLSGLAGTGLLFVLAATGALLALPGIAQALLAPTAIPTPRPAAPAGPRVSITRALATAQAALPDGRLVFFDVPTDAALPIRARFQVPGDPHRRFPGSFVFVDQISGRLRAVHDIRRGNTGTRLTSWIRPLHDGSVGGMPTRLLAVVTGILPTVLLVTGALHWRRRRRATVQQS